MLPGHHSPGALLPLWWWWRWPPWWALASLFNENTRLPIDLKLSLNPALCLQAYTMGTSASKSDGWRPAPPSGSQPKMSKSGFNVAPMSEEEQRKAAAGLTDFQR